jgi:hypothetical protein
MAKYRARWGRQPGHFKHLLVGLCPRMVNRGDDAGRLRCCAAQPACVPLSSMSENEALAARLTGLYEEWFAALGREGTGRLDEILADEWVYTNYDGAVRDKVVYLDHVASVVETVTFEGPYDLTVREYGDLALCLGGYRVTGLPDNAVFELRFTGLWIDRDGRRQCVFHHNSEVVTG